MPKLNFDLATFGGTPACRILMEKLNETGDKPFVTSVINRFSKYFEVVGELQKLDNPTRITMLKLWLETNYQDGRRFFAEKFEKYGIEFTYYHNILTHRMRQADEHGALLEKFRGDNMEHSEILTQLNLLARAAKWKLNEE